MKDIYSTFTGLTPRMRVNRVTSYDTSWPKSRSIQVGLGEGDLDTGDSILLELSEYEAIILSEHLIRQIADRQRKRARRRAQGEEA